MKQGLDLMQLAEKLTGIEKAKRDFIADTRSMEVIPTNYPEDNDEVPETGLALQLRKDLGVGRMGVSDFPLQQHALNQITERVKMPRKYVKRLADYPELLAHNINTLFEKEPEQRMVRTLHGQTRAFLSNKFRIIDNFDIANIVLPILIKANAEVISCDVTFKKLYIKAKHPTLERVIEEWPEGAVKGQGHNIRQTLRGAVVVTNSEVGLGRVGFSPAIHTKECTNLAVWESRGFSKYHVGRARDGVEQLEEIYSDKTRNLADQKLLSVIQDLANASMDGTIFNQIVDDMAAARHDQIEADPIKTVELFANENSLRQDEQNNILTHLLQSGDLTRYGLHAAVTRASSDSEDYDRATELESLGGKVIEMKRSAWGQYAKAA